MMPQTLVLTFDCSEIAHELKSLILQIHFEPIATVLSQVFETNVCQA